MIDFTKRSTQAELMDNPHLPAKDLDAALKDISRVNKLLGGNQITLKAIDQLLEANPEKKAWTIVDVGCGDGEMLRRMADAFEEHPADINFIGFDISSNGIEIAKSISKEYLNITFHNQDVLKLDNHKFSCDILTCTLTLHHFSDKDIPVFLDQFVKLSRIAVVINDLHRSKIAYLLFKLFSRIFIKSEITKQDGLVSIASGFKKEELKTLSKKLDATHSSITWKWAFRYLWLIKTI